ncbi:hypothetical protein, partial [Enterobacter hormaechei]
ADRNRSHWSTSKTPSYTKSVSWQHHLLADAAFVSDCGEISSGKMYLRKDNEECYVFTLSKDFLTESPNIIKSLSGE